MSAAVTRARTIQLGKESTSGTAVAATKRYPGLLTFEEMVEFYEPPYPQQVRAGGVAGQLVNVMNGFKGSYESELTTEELIVFLSMCVKGGVTPTGAGADKTWAFAIPMAADPALNSYTLEFAPSDWSTKWARQVPYVFSPKIELSGGRNEVAKFKADLIGQKVVSGATVTAGQASWSGREPLKSNKFKLYMDDAHGSIGGTQKVLSLLSWKVAIVGGVNEETTIDGQTGLDFTTLRVGEPSIETELTCLYNGNADAELTKWRNAAYRAVRLIGTGSTVSSSDKTVQVDSMSEYVSGGVIGTSNDNDILTLKLKGKYQSGYAGMGGVTVINALTALV